MILPLILTMLAIISGLLYIWAARAGSARQRYLFKPLTTALILVLAATLTDPVSDIYRWLVVLGILFSIGGDIFLMLPQDRFVFGLISFLIAHLFFIFAYLSRTGFHFTWWIFAIYAVYTGLLIYLLWPHAGSLRAPVLVYGLILMVMGWQAAEQWWVLRDPSALLAALGAILFLLSDSVLALDKFRAPIANRDVLIMTTYYGALMLIAWSVHQFGAAI
ncbi:MAG: lysoplasmalogenase [Anaerolineales bacterium]|nr:lysoplasmalogenase [Anaerolineales bacterium]